MRKYEDLEIGEEAVSSPLTVNADEMLHFARKYDPQWFHADAEKAKSSVFGEMIASGIYTTALWRQLDHTINGDIDFICGIAWEDVRWPNPVKAGDELRAKSRIIEKRPSQSEPERGVVVFLYTVINQHNDDVFSCRSINLVRRRLSQG